MVGAVLRASPEIGSELGGLALASQALLTIERANQVWDDFEIADRAGASTGEYLDDDERNVNAYLLNAIGMAHVPRHVSSNCA